MVDENPKPPQPEQDPGSNEPGAGPPRPRNFTGVALIIIVVVIVYLVIQSHLAEPKTIKYPKLIEYLARGLVTEIEVERNAVEIKLDRKKKDGGGSQEELARLILPQAVISERSEELEELAEMGRDAAKNDEDGTEAMLLHLARLNDPDQGGPKGGFKVYRRFIVKIGKKDQLLVRMTRPSETEEGRGGEMDFDVTGRTVTYLFKPGEVRDEARGLVYQITFDRLTELTNASKANALGGLPGMAEITTNLNATTKGVIAYAEEPGLMQTILISLAPWILIIAFLWFFIFRQMRNNGMGGNVLSFGRSRAKIANREKSTVTFADVAGIEEAKDEVTEIVDFLRHPGRFARLGGRIPRGVLLVGPPGTGKTLLAKAIAGEADVPFYSISGSDFVEMFVGVGASRVRDLFKQARENSPCIIFLDEIDAVGRRRGAGLGGGHDEREQTLNAILVEMDGFDTDTGIIVLAATNRSDVLDPALLRPGRFDREIGVDLPDAKGREGILRVHARKVKLHPSVDLTTIARGTPGFSGAELEAVVNEAAILATQSKKDYVHEEDLEEGRDRVRWGRSKTSRILDEDEQKITAYHEAGHTLAALLSPGSDPIHKVTIIPRGQALGATMYLPEKDQYSLTVSKAKTHLKVCFGGRIAEELSFDDVTSGAANDFKQATSIARKMVREWGMSENLGPVSYEEQDDNVFLGRDIGRAPKHSESTAAAIDAEVSRILVEAYESCKALLQDNGEKLRLLAENLLEYEMLTREEIEGLMNDETVETVRERAEAAKKAVEIEAAETAAPRPDTPPTIEPEPEPDFPPGLAGEGAS